MAAADDNAKRTVPILGTYVPKMGTTFDGSGLGPTLFGRVRGLVLGLLLGRPEERYYTGQIIATLGAGRGAVQRELTALTDAGILLREQDGRQVYYRANPDCPIYPELVSMVRKTVGLVDVLRSALETLGERVAVAFVYGSMATGTANASSDVDLMVIVAAGFGDVVEALEHAQDALGREVNPSVYSEAEVRRRIGDGEHFITSVMREKKLFVIGGPDDLERVAGARLADATPDQQA